MSYITTSHEQQPCGLTGIRRQPCAAIPSLLQVSKLARSESGTQFTFWARMAPTLCFALRKGQIPQSPSSFISPLPLQKSSTKICPGSSNYLSTPPNLTIIHHCYLIWCLQSTLQPLLRVFPLICKVLYNYYYKSVLGDGVMLTHFRECRVPTAF